MFCPMQAAIGSLQRMGRCPNAPITARYQKRARHLPHLFDRFYRVDEARSYNEDDEATSGSGLGLAIVKSTVEAQGGRVQAHSHPGEGAAFTVWLPEAKQTK